MGLVDGVNPCAMWVLIVLLGILLHVEKRSRMLLYSAAFIVMSGVVYFVFMTAWATLFRLVGRDGIHPRHGYSYHPCGLWRPGHLGGQLYW